jgi:hypothetical protein
MPGAAASSAERDIAHLAGGSARGQAGMFVWFHPNYFFPRQL